MFEVTISGHTDSAVGSGGGSRWTPGNTCVGLGFHLFLALAASRWGTCTCFHKGCELTIVAHDYSPRVYISMWMSGGTGLHSGCCRRHFNAVVSFLVVRPPDLPNYLMQILTAEQRCRCIATDILSTNSQTPTGTVGLCFACAQVRATAI